MPILTVTSDSQQPTSVTQS